VSAMIYGMLVAKQSPRDRPTAAASKIFLFDWPPARDQARAGLRFVKLQPVPITPDRFTQALLFDGRPAKNDRAVCRSNKEEIVST